MAPAGGDRVTRGVLDLLDRADQILAGTEVADRKAKNRLHNARLHIQEVRRILDRNGLAHPRQAEDEEEVTSETQPGKRRRP